MQIEPGKPDAVLEKMSLGVITYAIVCSTINWSPLVIRGSLNGV